jgi:putative ABC transport system ATP-binding protein
MLLADEPTASLDTDTGKNLVELMLEIGKEQGCTMIISTHDPEICALADKTIYLKDGERLKEVR